MFEPHLKPETVSKIDAAKRQLATAIELWFRDGDAVSIYTLSHAAYEVIHEISKPTRKRDLLFDSIVIKDEYQKEYVDTLKRPANFFKHGLRGSQKDRGITFYPVVSELFFVFSIAGLELLGSSAGEHGAVFQAWVAYNRPHLLTPNGRNHFKIDSIPVEVLDQIRGLSRNEFFEKFIEAFRTGTAPTFDLH